MGQEHKRRVRAGLAAITAGLALAGWLVGPAGAQKPRTALKFALDFTIQGPQGIFLLANDKGYLGAENLNVTIDRGFGSGDTVTKVAAGAYDMGFGDINSAIEFNAKNPGTGVIAVAMIYNAPPHSIITLKGKGIASPKDLEGKTVASPPGDASRRLFPVYARAVGIDAAKVNFVNVDGALREATLARGQVDAITGFDFTSVPNLKAARVNGDDIITFSYGSVLKNLYGNAVITTPAYLARNPEVVRGFLRALTRAFKDTVSNPDEAIAAVKRRDPLTDATVEKDRLVQVMKKNILVRDVDLFGFGQVRKDRLQATIKTISEAFELPVRLKADQVFTDKYLPPLADRLPPGKRGF